MDGLTRQKARLPCQRRDPEDYFPSSGGSRLRASRLCHGCPRLLACREEALADPRLVGIWGGTTLYQRNKTRKGK